MPERQPIGVIGAGWVGLVTAACFSELGHQVHVRDIVQEKVESLARGEVPIYEPGLSELILKTADRLHFTTDMGEVLSNAHLLFCCVDTPPLYSGDADLSRVERVVEELGDSREHAIVMKSTVPVGTGRSIRRRRDDLGYVSNPEFLKEGTAVEDFMHPDRVVVGAGPESQDFGDRVAALYEPLGGPIVRTDVESAEMIKLASNAFLATKISFINEIANVSEDLGADVEEVARGMGLDERIGPRFLKAGVGYGGSCLPGDETVLVRHHGRPTVLPLEELWSRLTEDDEYEAGVIEPGSLEVLAWIEELGEQRFMPVAAVTRREFEGQLIELRTKMGRRIRCTPDHPWLVSDGSDSTACVKEAADLTAADWLPIAQGGAGGRETQGVASLIPAVEAAGVTDAGVITRVPRDRIASVVERPMAQRRSIFSTSPSGGSWGSTSRRGTWRSSRVALGYVTGPHGRSTRRTRSTWSTRSPATGCAMASRRACTMPLRLGSPASPRACSGPGGTVSWDSGAPATSSGCRIKSGTGATRTNGPSCRASSRATARGHSLAVARAWSSSSEPSATSSLTESFACWATWTSWPPTGWRGPPSPQRTRTG